MECAYETSWVVRDGYLDMTLHQRSSDYIVANTINKIQYCALLMMVAKATGLKPGVFMHVVENMHLYDRHENNAEELLSRNPSNKQPKLLLDTDKTDFYSFTIDDFKLIDFECDYPQLKFELAI
jgi:thymidylate synthase